MLGWDIGGVNTKAALVAAGQVVAASSRPFELQRAPHALAVVLRELAADLNCSGAAAHAVTMTAELSQMFRTKRDGVRFVLDAIESAFPDASIYVFTVDGRFVSPADARQQLHAVAAANWAATAFAVASHYPDGLLIDIGTTTTDLIPIVNGAPAAEGRTDPERLASGELVYTGAVRTPVEAIVSHVPLGGGTAGVSAEGFALAGDVHVWRGDLSPGDYSVPTPDGRSADRKFAGERLARIVCGDRDCLDAAAIDRIADAAAAAQQARIVEAMRRVLARHPFVRAAIVTGLGAFVGARAARAAGLDVVFLADELGEAAARCAPAASVALLLDRRLGQDHARPAAVSEGHRRGPDRRLAAGRSSDPSPVDVVVKVGGALLGDLRRLDEALAAIGTAPCAQRLLVVPGGGPFADTVRQIDRNVQLTDEGAHWMAILGMDQYAHLLVERLKGSVLVFDRDQVARATALGQIPVLAPSQWLRAADPLPHSWEVTSDSIAAWVAGELGATRLVLIKPAGAIDGLVDPCFERALPASVTARIVTADRIDALCSELAVRQQLQLGGREERGG